MELKELWISLSKVERNDLARRCGTTFGHLRNVVYGKCCGEKLAIAIDRETGGRVSCNELRPDVDWEYLRRPANRPLSCAA